MRFPTMALALSSRTGAARQSSTSLLKTTPSTWTLTRTTRRCRRTSRLINRSTSQRQRPTSREVRPPSPKRSKGAGPWHGRSGFETMAPPPRETAAAPPLREMEATMERTRSKTRPTLDVHLVPGFEALRAPLKAMVKNLAFLIVPPDRTSHRAAVTSRRSTLFDLRGLKASRVTCLTPPTGEVGGAEELHLLEVLLWGV